MSAMLRGDRGAKDRGDEGEKEDDDPDQRTIDPHLEEVRLLASTYIS